MTSKLKRNLLRPRANLERYENIKSKVRKNRDKVKWLREGDIGSINLFNIIRAKKIKEKISGIQVEGSFTNGNSRGFC